MAVHLEPWEIVGRIVTSLLFLGESPLAGEGVLAPNDAPFWSLNYEAMYYWLFAAWVFLRGYRRLLAVCLIAAFAGPLVLLLLPCWLVGIAVHRLAGRSRMSGPTAAAAFATSLLALVAVWYCDLPMIAYQALRHYLPLYRMRFSNRFVTDYLVAFLVGMHFLAAARFPAEKERLMRFALPIRTLAGGSLTIYLFHLPLAFLAIQWLGLSGWPALAAVVLPLIPLAWVTEHRRGSLRRLLERWAPRWGSRHVRGTPRVS